VDDAENPAHWHPEPLLVGLQTALAEIAPLKGIKDAVSSEDPLRIARVTPDEKMGQ